MGAMGRRESVAMLEAAFDAGIRHFDVAPMYGFGQAEGCLGEFLGRHRADVTVTTKYGIPPAKNQGLIGLARVLARRVYRCSAAGRFEKDFALRDQIRRAAVSVMSNIAEGFERGGAAEFSQFLSVAKGSAAEVQCQLYVALDAGYISSVEFEELQDLAASAKRCLGGFMKYLRRSPLRGQKFNRARAAVTDE